MKRFTSGDDVVVTMTRRECNMMCMLVTSGIIRKMEDNFWTEEDINEWKKLRDQLCDYEQG